MTLLIILACIFGGLALIVMFTERFGKPQTPEQQAKLSKIAIVLVFVLLVSGLIKALMS